MIPHRRETLLVLSILFSTLSVIVAQDAVETPGESETPEGVRPLNPPRPSEGVRQRPQQGPGIGGLLSGEQILYFCQNSKFSPPMIGWFRAATVSWPKSWLKMRFLKFGTELGKIDWLQKNDVQLRGQGLDWVSEPWSRSFSWTRTHFSVERNN